MPTTSRAHLWQPLDSSKRQIRLLALQPNTELEALPSGTLEVKSLDRHPVFDAISHAWGNPSRTPPLYLNGVRVPITESLNACLRHLRHPKEVRRFWVDAICIKQDDVTERNQQVQQMEHIFRAAGTVRVWLGDFQSQHMPRVFDIMNQVGRFETELEDTRVDGELLTSKDISNLALFTRSAWFERLWVRQEAALARNLSFHHNDCQVRLGEIRYFYATYEHRSVRASMQEPDDRNLYDQAKGKLAELCAIPELVTTYYSNRLAAGLALIFFMCGLREAKVQDVRDRIFGLVAVYSVLFDDDLVKVNYTLRPQEIFTNFAYKLIVTTKSLAIFNQVSHDENSMPSLPSWVPDWSSAHHFTSSRRLLYSNNALFKASQDWNASAQHFDELRGWLRFRGLVVVGIVSTSVVCDIDPFRSGDTMWYTAFESRTILDAVERWQKKASTVPKITSGIFARTIFRDLVSVSSEEESYHMDRIGTDVTASHTLEKAKDDLSHGKGSNEVFALSRAIARSRFFICNDGRPGLGPPDTQEGDAIAILLGGNVPYVLRRSQQQSIPGKGEIYRFVGECYVHGIMDGQAIEGMQEKDFSRIWLE